MVGSPEALQAGLNYLGFAQGGSWSTMTFHVFIFTIVICTSLDTFCTQRSVKLECYFTTKTSPLSNIPPLLRPKAIHPNAYFLV